MPRTAQSSYLQLLNGNPNNKTKKELYKRTKNEKRLQVSAVNMSPPAWLASGAKKEFERIINLYQESKLLNELDINTLAIYCDLLMEYKSLNASLKKHGKTFNDGVKYDVSPIFKEKRQLAPQIDKYARQLGLTPAARASLAINLSDDSGDNNDDDF